MSMITRRSPWSFWALLAVLGCGTVDAGAARADDKKPGALTGSRPLAQCRAQGLWPLCFDAFWQACQKRLGKHEGTRVMVELLLLGREQGWPALRKAVESALALGSSDASVVRCELLTPVASVPIAALPLDQLGRLSRYERPMPEMSGYDQLLAGAR